MTRNTSTEEFLAYPEPDDDGTDEPTTVTSGLVAPHLSLGGHLLEAAMTPAQLRRFRYSPGLSVLIEAPTPAWVAPLRSAAAGMANWQHIEARDGTARHARKPTEGENELARVLGAGHRLVAVSHAPERLLPPSVVAAADMRIRTGHPTAAVIRKAIRDATGTWPRPGSDKLGARLDFFDLVSAIRVGSDARSCLDRLARATAGMTVVTQFQAHVPPLEDLCGYGEAGQWAKRLVDDVNAWRRGEIPDFSTIDRQIVFAGPPGTGKTTLVASIAKSSGLPLITTSVAKWFIDGTGYLDSVLKQAEATFSKAADAAPAILFLDEIDAIPNRATTSSRNADYWAPIVGYILQFLDGISSSAPSSFNLVIIGATNFGDALDPALVRPGRLSRVIKILPPDEEAIPGILRQHLGKDLEGVDLGHIGGVAVGATGAVIAGWAKGARRRARVARRPMEIGDLMAEILAPDNRSPGAIWRCAVHEVSHALAAHMTGSCVVQTISILANPTQGGRMIGAYPDGEVTRTRADIENMIVTALAGRAGEIVFGMEASTGSYSDLTTATNLAASIHASFGMGEGLVQRRLMDRAASLLDEDANFRRLIEMSLKAFSAQAVEIITRYRDLVEVLANRLVKDRQIDGVAFRELIDGYERKLVQGPATRNGGPRHG
ncbi:ATP-dependent zinc metalloprotease FtsH [Methylobacterium marchantiae]|nr:ATP-dependent zinc metalloprotease FtsH [Methylobacterium marchantiae]